VKTAFARFKKYGHVIGPKGGKLAAKTSELGIELQGLGVAPKEI
jgi:hypothetical protein